MDPPAYDAIDPNHGERFGSCGQYSKTPTRLSLRDEIYLSRLQRVAALVVQLLPHIRARAQQGLSKSSLLILPADTTSSTKGQLVGFPQDMIPTVIQLEGGNDGTQFWTQQEVVQLLREQILAAVVDEMPKPEDIASVSRIRPESEPKGSFWGRKQSRTPAARYDARPLKLPATVEVEHDIFSFRAETQYGLFETLRAQAVLVIVDVK